MEDRVVGEDLGGDLVALPVHSERPKLERIPTPTPQQVRKDTRKSAPSLKTVMQMKQSAMELAEMGDEREALSIYKSALQLAVSEIDKITCKIQKSKYQHTSKEKSSGESLKQDLLRVVIASGKIRTEMALLLERDGCFDQSIICCREAKQLYKQPVLQHDNISITDEMEKVCELMSLMIEKLELAKSFTPSRTEMVAKITDLRNQIAGTCDKDERKNLYKQVKQEVENVKTLDEKAFGAEHPRVSDSLLLLSALALEQKEESNALDYLESGLTLTKKSLGMKHPRTAKFLNHIARLHRDHGRDDIAMTHFEQAVSVLRQSREKPRVLGTVLNDMSVLHMRKSEFDRAVEGLKEALNKFREDSEQENGQLCIDALRAWWNLGDCYRHQSQEAQAAEAFEKALDLQRNARKIHDLLSGYDLEVLGAGKPLLRLIDDESIANTLVRLGKATAASGQHPKALDAFQDALDVSGHCPIPDDEACIVASSANVRAAEGVMASIHFCMAESYCAIGNHEEAICSYNMSIQVYRSSSAHKQDRQAVSEHCGKCYLRIGDVYLSKKAQVQAYRFYQKALECCKEDGVADANSVVVATTEKRISEIKAVLTEDSPKRDAEMAEKADKEMELGDFD
jgi:tetratricopeptide (TPR) repeat protein